MNEQELKTLKEEALSALRDAAQKMYDYAAACEIGEERTKAFEMQRNIRHAVLVS